MSKFWDLVRESIIFSGTIALILVVTCCWMWVQGDAVPDALMAALTMVLGYFFGAKAVKDIRRGG
ncbi:MAG: hypothetical protein SXV54_14000 [Chloroflexota bacterium]|nr:hypothetical protein [Chloroflexota bacterium]